MERYLELSHPLVSARSPPLWPHLLSPASGIHLANQRQGDRRISCWLVTPHNGLTRGRGRGLGSSLLVWHHFLWTDRQPFLLKSLLNPSILWHECTQLARSQTWPASLLRVVIRNKPRIVWTLLFLAEWISPSEPRPVLPRCYFCSCWEKEKGEAPNTQKVRTGIHSQSRQIWRRSNIWKLWMSLELKARTLVQVSAGMGLLLITTSCACWKPLVECHTACAPTMSPSSQSRVFYFEEQFPRGCFSFSQQVQYQTECVCSGERGGGGSLLLNKRLFTILSFELNIEISLKTCTPMTYECGELMTSKWGPKLLSTPRGGLLTGDCEKPANTRTTSGQHPRTT